MLMSLAFWQSGCFTEVGNAEDDRLVSAKFQIDLVQCAPVLNKVATQKVDSFDVNIFQFYVNVKEAEFYFYDSVKMNSSEYHLWKFTSDPLPIDFSGQDPIARLPVESVGRLIPRDFYLTCSLPNRKSFKVDTIDFKTFSDRGYIKGRFIDGKFETNFLFAMPKSLQLRLQYTPEQSKRWLVNGMYTCDFIFCAKQWLLGVDLSKAAMDKDKMGNSIVIINDVKNAAIYQTLSDSFYKSFNTTLVKSKF